MTDASLPRFPASSSEISAQQLIEHCPIGLVLCRLDGTLITVNQSFADLLGRSIPEILSLTYWQITPESYLTTEQSQFANLAIAKHCDPYEKEYLHKAGHHVSVQLSRTIIEHQGETLVWSSVTDISARKRSQDHLLREYNLLQSIIQSTPDPIFVKDLQGRYLVTNAANASLFGLPISEVLNKDDTAFMSSEAAAKLWETDRRIVQTGISETVEDTIVVEGTPHIFLATKSLWCDEQGNPLGVMGIARDISDRKHAERELRHYQETLEERVKHRTTELTKANRKLLAEIIERQQIEHALRQSETREREKADRLEQALRDLQRTQAKLVQSEKMSSLGQLVAGIAHEINNPVNFIYGNIIYTAQYTEDLVELINLYQKCYPQSHPDIIAELEAIDFEFVREDLPRMLDSIKVGAERIREIVLSLRNFSRVDEAQMKSVDIHEGIESTLMILQNRLKAKPDRPAIEVIKNYGQLPKVECYPGQLNQVLMNLLCNAIDALESHWELATASGNLKAIAPLNISIRTDLDQDWVKVHIADNGIGMSEQTQQQLFNLFFTTKPVGKGTGLGLPISYQIIVEKHKGHFYCESKVGEGSEFIIEIPLKQTANLQE